MPGCLHLLNAYLPRTETFIWQNLRRARRYTPLVLADAWENLEAFPLPGGELIRLKPSRPWWSRVNARLSGTYAPVRYPEGALRTRDIAVCHAHNGFRACVTLGFATDFGKPWVVNFYGSDLSQAEFLRRARAYPRVFRQSRALLVEGPAMRQRLLELGAPAKKIRIQRIAVDPAEYPFRERSWDGNREIRLLFVGRMVEKKGLAVGLQALADRRLDFPWNLTVVGDGLLRPQLEAQAERLNLSKRVDFLGMRSLEETRSLMESCDLLLQPSHTGSDGDGEGGAPTIILEAQACGMPVLSTLHDDIPYVTVPERSAWLAPEGNADALAENLRRAAREASRWAGMGRAGRAKIEADHDVVREIEALERCYDEVSG